ncbi:MAG: tripartite tricarboxylate transporter substrate binding protein [Pseudomonadota bacterium]
MNFKHAVAVALAFTTTVIAGNAAVAQDYPAKPIRFIVPFPPGGAGDTLARTVAQPLSRALGQNVVVENRTGANTLIATEITARAPADGYTLQVMATSFTVNPSAYSKLPYDSLRDFSPVTRLAYNPLIICVHPSVPVRTLKELVSLARARPGELTWAVSSIIGGGRIAGEIFREVAKVDMTNVPYGGGAPAATAVLGGHTSMLIGNVLDCSPYIASGRMRPIAVTSARRAELLKDVPTIAESGYPGFDVTNWFGTIVRAGTPRPVVDRLSAEVGKALLLPEVVSALGKLGLTPGPMTPAEFEAFIRREMQGNEKIIRKFNLKIE